MTRTTTQMSQPHIGPTKTSAGQRVLLAKVGLDGHDRGIKVVARGLRDHGFQVIYGGIWQSPDAVAQATLDEDADWLGLSLLNGAHLTLVPRVLEALHRIGNRRTQCVFGGIIPDADVAELRKLGVDGFFGPGTSISAITEFLRQARVAPDTQDDDTLVGAVGGGDRVALARLLTLISRGRVDSEAIAAGRSIRTVAITGSAGVGKSSLIADLAARLVKQDRRVAVLACDPQSPLSGGALLGDRVRISAGDTCDPRLLVRSLAVASGQQGITEYLGTMILALQLFGFDVVMIESVGAGQGDVAVRQFAEQVILLLQPESGDGVQWEKAGLLEVADLVVINKSDLPGADRLESELNQHLNIPGYRDVPIIRASATKGDGIEKVCQYMMA